MPPDTSKLTRYNHPMAHRATIFRLLIAALIAFAAAFALLPQVSLGGSLIEGREWIRASAGPHLLPYRFEAPAGDPLSSDFDQVRTAIRHERGDYDLTLILIDADADTRVYLNNIRVRSIEPSQDPNESGLSFVLPADFRHEGVNTLDIVTPKRGTRHGPPLAVLAESEADIDNVRRYLQLNSRSVWIAAVVGLFAAALSFVSLAIAPLSVSGRWSLAGLALSLSLAANPTALITGTRISIEVVSTGGMASALVAATFAAVLVGNVARASRSRAWVGAFLLAAAVGALCLFMGWAGSLWGASFDPWPAAVLAGGRGLALLVMVALTIALVVEATRAATSAIRRALEQDALIREQKETIARQSEDLEAQIHRRAVLEERARFSRDIHDGLGGSLLSLLVDVRSGNVESDDLEAALESNLDELRMMIDSLDHAERSLNSALSTFQTRVRQLFDNADIALDWSQPDTALPERATPDFILHLYRILQEAGSNIVRHSQASRAEYRFDWDETNQQLRVSISDNGMASPPQGAPPGNGLNNMARRVEEMRGKFEAGPEPEGGWAIRFSVPV